MSMLPPAADHIGQLWVDPLTANRFEWDGDEWLCLGPNAEVTKQSRHLVLQEKQESQLAEMRSFGRAAS